MEIDIIPEIVPDFTLWGKPDFFNFDEVKDVVQISWPNGVKIEIPRKVFDTLKFSIPDKQVNISKISAVRTDEFQRLRGVFSNLAYRKMMQGIDEKQDKKKI